MNIIPAIQIAAGCLAFVAAFWAGARKRMQMLFGLAFVFFGISKLIFDQGSRLGYIPFSLALLFLVFGFLARPRERASKCDHAPKEDGPGR